MDLDENIEHLIKAITTIKKQVNDLKSHDINSTLNELELETEALKDEITDLRQTLMQQNESILSLIRKQNDRRIGVGNTCDFSKIFPLKSLKELDELEENINVYNINELIAIVRLLLQPKSIVNNIRFIMAPSLIMACNIDGQKNKRRLLNSPKFMDLIYRAVYDGACSKELYFNEFRRSLHIAKKRYNQRLYHKNSKERKNTGLKNSY